MAENSRTPATSDLSPEELEAEQSTDLPDREALSAISAYGAPHFPIPLPPIELPDSVTVQLPDIQPAEGQNVSIDAPQNVQSDIVVNGEHLRPTDPS